MLRVSWHHFHLLINAWRKAETTLNIALDDFTTSRVESSCKTGTTYLINIERYLVDTVAQQCPHLGTRSFNHTAFVMIKLKSNNNCYLGGFLFIKESSFNSLRLSCILFVNSSTIWKKLKFTDFVRYYLYVKQSNLLNRHTIHKGLKIIFFVT